MVQTEGQGHSWWVLPDPTATSATSFSHVLPPSWAQKEIWNFWICEDLFLWGLCICCLFPVSVPPFCLFLVIPSRNCSIQFLSLTSSLCCSQVSLLSGAQPHGSLPALFISLSTTTSSFHSENTQLQRLLIFLLSSQSSVELDTTVS